MVLSDAPPVGPPAGQRAVCGWRGRRDGVQVANEERRTIRLTPQAGHERAPGGSGHVSPSA